MKSDLFFVYYHVHKKSAIYPFDYIMDFDPKKDYYTMLWVSETATTDEIKKAFRKLAVKHHPDRGGSKEEFQKVNEAHGVLSDEKKRQQYDAYRKGGFGGMGGNGGFDFGGFGGASSVDFDIGDLIGNIFWGGFWGGGGRSWPIKGDDLKKIIEISFEEAFLGCEKKISYERLQKVDGVKEETCSACNGRGKVAQQVQTMFGVMQTQTACPTCQGYGKIFTKDGKTISNGGLQEQKETVEIKIPAGIKDDAYIKYPSKGDAGIGDAPTGDLYLKIRILPTKKYRRKDDDLYITSEISLFELVLGGEIEVAHPEGKMKVKIPKGTQIWDKIKITGKGFWDKGIFQRKGDMFVETTISIPKKLSKQEEKLWKELQDLEK